MTAASRMAMAFVLAMGGGGPPVNTYIGDMPTLPGAYDALVTDAATFISEVNSATAGVRKYIAIQDGATIDLGSTNGGNGMTDYTLLVSNKDITVAPASWYGDGWTFQNNPYGDGLKYSRKCVRPATLKGWLDFRGGNPQIYGLKCTVDGYPTAPTSSTFQRWTDIGIKDSSFLHTYIGSGQPDFGWNEYYIGKDAAKTPFSISAKEYDYNSPDYWCYATDGTNVRATQVNASFTAATSTMTVNSIALGAMPLQVGTFVMYMNGTTKVSTTIASLGTGTGGVGTYILAAAPPADLAGLATVCSVKANNAAKITDADVILQGWNDNTDYPQYNRYSRMPSAVMIGLNNAGTATDWTGDLGYVRHNDIHDLYDGARVKNMRTSSVSKLVNTDNHMERLYHDYNRFNYGDEFVNFTVHWMRNIHINPIANGRDGGNPHGDEGQAYGENTGNTTGHPLAHWRIIGNLAYIDANCRGVFQSNYFQMLYDHYLLGALVKDCIAIGVNKFWAGLLQHSTLIRNCVSATQELNRPYNDPGNPSVIGWYSSIYVNRAPTSISIPNSVMRVENTIAERLALSSGNNKIDTLFYRSPLIGGATGRSNTVFTDLNRTCSTVNDMFLAAKQLTGSAGSDGLSVASLSEMMSLGIPTDVRAYFVTQGGVAPSSTVTTSKAYVHGDAGTVVNVVPDAGVSWESYDDWTGAVVRAMATGNGTIEVGNLIAWRGTASASYLTETALGGSINGVDCKGRVITPSNTFYTVADNQTTAWSRIAKPTDARTFKGFVIGLIGLKADAWTNAAQVLCDKNTNAYCRIGLSTLGGGRFATNFCGSTSTEGGSKVNFDVGTDTTNRHTYLIRGDFTQTDANEVLKLVKDYTQIAQNSPNINTTGTKTFNIANFFGASGIGLFNVYAGGGTIFDGRIEALWIDLYDDPANIPDITNVDVINAFTRDMLDVNGNGSVTGVLAQPMVFVKGSIGATDGSTADTWNATGGITNLGYGGNALIKQAGTYA